MTGHTADAEPHVDTPAGLPGAAAELLTLCDQLLNHPGHDTIAAQLHALLRRHRCPNPAATSRRLRTTLTTIAAELHRHLHDQGIIVDHILAKPRV